MKKKYQNIFFAFGIAVLAVMVAQLDFAQVSDGLRHAGYWFAAVVGLWALLYVLNTAAWYVIIRAGGKADVKFWWLYKISVSGFALNYATPGGLMGGEPYRIMMLAPKIGTERASSSVILYVMTHIFSHFWFWLLSVLLFVCLYPLNALAVGVAAGGSAFCLLGLWFFIVGYKKGIAMRLMRWMSHVPLLKRWALRFAASHTEQIETVDRQIAALHAQNTGTLVVAVGLELLCRIASAAEIYFIIRVLMPGANYVSCVLILAFTSLFANLLFFIPLQLGGREGGFLMSVSGLGFSASTGIFVALIVRLRELVWTGIGLLLIKIGNGGDLPKAEQSEETPSLSIPETPPTETQ